MSAKNVDTAPRVLHEDAPAGPRSVSWDMFIAAHRAQVPRRRRRRSEERVLVFAPDQSVLRWIEHELFAERVTTQIVESFADVVTNLTLVPPPWPQFLIIDAEAVTPADSDLLRAIREAGWPGTVIAIGEPPPHVRHALDIGIVLARTLGSEVLRSAIKEQLRYTMPTVPMRTLAR